VEPQQVELIQKPIAQVTDSCMNAEQIKRKLDKLIALSKESEWLEFKQASHSFHFDKLGKYFSALSNEANLKGEDCGWLVFGVKDKNRKIVGTQYRSNKAHLDKLKSEIANETTNRITFKEIYDLHLFEGRVIMFQIPAAPKGMPIAWKGVWYGRDGEALSTLNILELEQIRNQIKTDWSAQICPEATIDDLDPEAILKAREEFRNKNPKLSDELSQWDDITFLNKAKVTINGKITNTAIILLGKGESEHFISPAVAKITWIVKDANDIEKDYEHFGPPLILNAERVFTKIRNLKYRYLVNETLFPTEINQYDPWVIREALHNCIAHQDYELKGKINLVEKPDELIFSNVGSFIPENIETVINPNWAPEIYRNSFLTTAMVGLNMIDTIGSGIRKMFKTQMERFFPLPDYDLTQPERVSVKIQGRILNENYTRLLIRNKDIDLPTVMLLDKVQKRFRLSKDEHKFLKSRRLVEGRYPNLFVSSYIAAATEQKAKYIRYRGFDKKYYQDMVIEFIRKNGSVSRKEINDLILSKLPEILTEKQKKSKINNMLNEMSGKLGIIVNTGPKKYSQWVLTSK
jgi:ATP-dependent DNA helicase RecG